MKKGTKKKDMDEGRKVICVLFYDFSSNGILLAGFVLTYDVISRINFLVNVTKTDLSI